MGSETLGKGTKDTVGRGSVAPSPGVGVWPQGLHQGPCTHSLPCSVCSQECNSAPGTTRNLHVSLCGNDPATRCIRLPKDLSRRKPNVVVGAFASAPQQKCLAISSRDSFLKCHFLISFWSKVSPAKPPAPDCVLCRPHTLSCPLYCN